MSYFFYNTDNKCIGGKRRYPIMLREGFAATSGPASYGEQLAKLNPYDTLLMYDNGVGVVAVGTVREEWDRKPHKKPIYYLSGVGGFEGQNAQEYRIRVKWFRKLSKTPISMEQLLENVGYLPQSAVTPIKKREPEVEKLLASLDALPIAAREPCDLDVPPPDRVTTTVSRVIRDTKLSKKVKELHEYRCQLCGHVIEFSDGSPYAEAHHIQPLGSHHNGPDVIGNLLCVCPNHHVELDYGSIKLDLKRLRQHDNHRLIQKYIDYHNRAVFGQSRTLS